MLVIPSALGMAGEDAVHPTMEEPKPTPRTLAREPAVEQAPPSPAPPTPATARHTLDRSLVRGIAWTGAIKWLSQILSWVSTIVVVRLLVPADYGIIGMATTYLSLVALINELGLGAAIITQRDLSDDQIRQINSVCVLLGFAGFLVSAAVAIPLSVFFRAPDLHGVITVMSLAYLVSGFQTAPAALLQRELRFKFLAVTEGLQSILQALATVILALLGFKYWSIVLGGLVGTVFLTIAVASERWLWFAVPRLRSIGHALTFSWQILVTRLSWWVSVRADYLIAGRMLGQSALGIYSVASTMALLPAEKITGLVSRVSFPLFSAVQHDQAGLRRYLLVLTEGLALASFALAFGLALVTDEFVFVVLGAKWADAILPLRILAILTTLRAIYPVVPQALTVTGGARFIMWVGVATAVVAPVAFYFGSWWGITGMAVTWCVLQPSNVVPVYWLLKKRLDVGLGPYLKSLSPALTASLAMALVVWLLKAVLPAEWPLRDRFIVEVAGGGAAYLLVVLTIHRDRLRALLDLLRPPR
jgi:PST family polysaccharide transporter